jgi:hypothetical protein
VIEGVLVEQMAKQGIETIVGARRDPQWGPVMLVGLGGIWAEALSDVRILPVGLDEAEIVREIRALRGAKLLAGMRGAAAADVAALARTVALIGAVVAEFVAGTGGQGAGLAYQILLAGIQLDIPRLFAALVLIALAGVAMFAATVGVSRLALSRWHESELRSDA